MGPVKIILLWAGDSSNQFYYLLPKQLGPWVHLPIEANLSKDPKGPLYNLVVLQISHLLFCDKDFYYYSPFNYTPGHCVWNSKMYYVFKMIPENKQKKNTICSWTGNSIDLNKIPIEINNMEPFGMSKLSNLSEFFFYLITNSWARLGCVKIIIGSVDSPSTDAQSKKTMAMSWVCKSVSLFWSPPSPRHSQVFAHFAWNNYSRVRILL